MKLSRPSAKTMRRSLTALAIVFALGGTALIAYPFATDLWAQRIQSGLTVEFASSAKAYQARTIEVGKPLTRMEIPKLDVDVMVVEGTTPAALHAGAGHYPETSLPGELGNVAIAGHRTTYGKPFNQIDRLAQGDRVWLLTPVGDFEYAVAATPAGWNANPYITGPRDWQVIEPTAAPSLTLTTCHPKGSAAQRLVVRGELVGSHPAGTYGAQQPAA